jgi:protein O-mannosyl-transferase
LFVPEQNDDECSMKNRSQIQHKRNPVIKTRPKGSKKPKNTIWLPWLVVVLLLIFTVYLYKPSLNNHFTNWDDPAYVLDNAQVKQLSAQNTTYFFTHASASNYHPLTMLSLCFDYQLTVKENGVFRETDELEAIVFHTTSLIFHLLNVLLVFVFIYLLTGKRLIVATVTALLFAIHPMHVESVAWIAGRKDVLYTFFFLAGLIAYLKYLEKGGWMRLLLTGFFFLGSLFSKPSAVVFPMVLLAIDYFHGRKFTGKVFYEKIPFFILAVIFGVITFMIQSQTAVAGIHVFTIFQRFMFASYGFIMYPFKLLLPLKISAFYPYPLLNAAGNLPLIYYLSPLIVVIIFVLIYFSTRFTRVFSFGFLFYFFTIVLVLQFISVGKAIMADRYSYLSAIGVFFIIAWWLDRAFVSKKKILRSMRWVMAGIFLLYSIILGKTAWEQTMVWRNTETLWTDVISKYPQAEVSYKNRGNYYGNLKITDKAFMDYMAFIQINHNDPGIYCNLGNIYGLRGETEKALESYSKSISLDSLDPKTFLNRAITYAKAKQYIPALKDFNQALALNPELLEIYTNRAYTFFQMERYEEAIDDFTLLIRNYPRNDNYFMTRGSCYYQLKQFPKALTDFEQTIVLNPANGRAYFNISVTYNELKDYRKAYQSALKAISLNFPVDKNFFETLKIKGG